jgi:UDP-N-acetylglucosamine--N-acetylmuramyl-(pentapeptide) pyrophosphoryl-undecaprenol N-acetylglucosamine transferase
MTTSKKNCICFAAGCSGGHIIPCLTLAHQELDKNPDTHVLFFTTNRALDKKILAHSPAVTHNALPLAASSYGKIKFPLWAWHLARSFFTSLRTLHAQRPSYVLTTGSHIAIPVCAAAWLLRIPIKLFEVNVLPGKTIKLLSPLAQQIFVLYPQTIQTLPKKKCILAQYPVKFSAKDRTISQDTALAAINHSLGNSFDLSAQNNHQSLQKKMSLSPDKKTILILGGSQGSLFLNQLMGTVLEADSSLRTQIQIIHQTGDLDTTDWRQKYAQLSVPAFVFAYHDQMAPCYAAANLILCRAGAGTLAELIFFQKKSIVIPLETKATDHQLDNALAATQLHPGLIHVARQENIINNPKKLATTILNLLA